MSDAPELLRIKRSRIAAGGIELLTDQPQSYELIGFATFDEGECRLTVSDKSLDVRSETAWRFEQRTLDSWLTTNDGYLARATAFQWRVHSTYFKNRLTGDLYLRKESAAVPVVDIQVGDRSV